jgi:hypothetical protein
VYSQPEHVRGGRELFEECRQRFGDSLLRSGVLVAVMAIPTKIDADLAAIDDLAGSVMISLTTLQHAGRDDVPGLRAVLRERLRDYVDRAMEMADESAAR